MEKVSLDKSSKEEMSEIAKSFLVLYDKSRKSFKEKDTVKNAWDEVTTALEFNLTVNYFYFVSFTSFFEIVLFIWLKLLVSRVPNLYPQHVFHHAEPVVCRCSLRCFVLCLILQY